MKTKNIKIVLLLILFAIFTLSSCGEAEDAPYFSKETTKDYAMEPAPGEAPSTAPPSPDGTIKPSDTNLTDTNTIKRKIIKRAQISIKVKDFLKAFDSIEEMVKSEGGFIADSSSYKSDLGNISGEITIRVSPDKFEKLVGKLNTLGDVKSKSISGEDITKQYYDLELRLGTKNEMAKRLLELLRTRTNNVKDLLEVERELGRVREEIESIKGTLRYYDNLLGLSTITISLEEPVPVSPAGNIWEPFKDMIRDALELFALSIRSLILFLMAVFPWLILAAIIFFIVRKIVRKRKREQKVEQNTKQKK